MAKNVFEMSDEEFMKQLNSGELDTTDDTPPKDQADPLKDDEPKDPPKDDVPPTEPTPPADDPKESVDPKESEDEPKDPNPPKDDPKEPKEPKEPPKDPVEPKEPKKEDTPPAGSEPDYKALYTSLMQPIKANGKTITIKDPKELVQLAQQGLNYTKKMQAIAPMRKLAQSLENAGLFTEDKLNYLIDLASGKKEAITKLLQDHKINPVDLETEEPSKYVPDNHQVSDSEVALKTVIEDLKSTPDGQETLKELLSWDNDSQRKLAEEPDAIYALDQQRKSGVFKIISDEVSRRQALGQLSTNMPALDAYTLVGKDLLRQQYQQQQQAALLKQPLNPGNNIPPAKPAVPAATPDQIKAAAPNRSPKTTPKKLVNPFDMSDEEFLKQYGNKY